jgi:hypothetical protein
MKQETPVSGCIVAACIAHGVIKKISARILLADTAKYNLDRTVQGIRES